MDSDSCLQSGTGTKDGVTCVNPNPKPMEAFNYTFHLGGSELMLNDNINLMLHTVLKRFENSCRDMLTARAEMKLRAETIEYENINLNQYLEFTRRDNQRLRNLCAALVSGEVDDEKLQQEGLYEMGASDNFFPDPVNPPLPRQTFNDTDLNFGDIAQQWVCKNVVNVHNEAVHGITVQDPNLVASASWDGTVSVYDLEKKEEVVRLDHDRCQADKHIRCGLYAVRFAKTAPHLLACVSNHRLGFVWNYSAKQLVRKLEGHALEVNGLAFHPTQQVICTCSDDATALVWDLQEGIVLRQLDMHNKEVYDVTFLGQEHEYSVATCCFDRITRVFDMRDKSISASLQGHTDDVIGIDYSSEKHLLATSSDDGMMIVYDTRKWDHLFKCNTRTTCRAPLYDDDNQVNQVKRCAFSSGGNYLAGGCSNGSVAVFDTVTEGRLVAELTGHKELVFGVAWTATGDIVSASHDTSWRHWKKEF